MKAIIVETFLGIFALDEKGIIDKILFSKPSSASGVGKQLRLSRGNFVEEELALVSRLKKKGYDQLVFESEGVANSLREKLKVSALADRSNPLSRKFRGGFEEMALKMGTVKSHEELRSLLLDVSLFVAREQMKVEGERRDLLIIQVINTLDELTKSLNLLSIKARDLYSLHFPELSRFVDKHDTYLKVVAELGSREGFSKGGLKNIGIGEEIIDKVVGASEASIGGDMSVEDVAVIRNLARSVLNLYSLKGGLEDYVGKLMEEVAPNVKAIAGPTVGARLIALAGGLKRMSMMPSSTIQVLGAEKALFRSLKTGTRPPKHGILFQHPDVHSARRELRGKISRLLANKIAVAARIDAFSGRVNPSLKEDYSRRLSRLSEGFESDVKA